LCNEFIGFLPSWIGDLGHVQKLLVKKEHENDDYKIRGWNVHEEPQNTGLQTWQAPIPDGDWRATKSSSLANIKEAVLNPF